jgi:ASC-1-like (ASCH) protein
MNLLATKGAVPIIRARGTGHVKEASNFDRFKKQDGKGNPVDEKMKKINDFKILKSDKPDSSSKKLAERAKERSSKKDRSETIESEFSSKKRLRDDDDEFPNQPVKTVRSEHLKAPNSRPSDSYQERHVPKPDVKNTKKNVYTHFLPMRGAIYMENIEKGIKEYEGRINGPACKKMQIGDHLKLYDNRANWGILCEITSLTVYYSFEKMLTDKGILKLLPQLERDSRILNSEQLLEKGVKIYKDFPGSERVSSVGVVAIGVQFLSRIYTK